MSTDNKISILLPRQIPDYVQEFYPLFVTFVTKYFEWLEQTGNAQETIQNLTLNRDIDTTASSLAVKFMQTYAPGMPVDAAADRSILVKHFRDFYARKGSEASFKFFFRAFFNDDVIIQRPSEYLFKTSDGTWYVERKLRVTAVTGNPLSIVNTTIAGSSTGARAAVNKVSLVTDDLGTGYDIILQNGSITGTFSSSEQIVATAWDWVNNTSSQVVLQNTRALMVDGGRWLDTKSQISDGQILQDSSYYQNFSYVIRTTADRERWYESVLNQLHTAGNAVFNDRSIDINIGSEDFNTGFATTVSNETTVQVPIGIPNFNIKPGFSFDRTANFNTGTSATTSAGSIVYDASYVYPGFNVTWALQYDAEFPADPRTTIVTGGPSFDKTGANVGVDENLTAEGNNVNFTLSTELFHNTSNLTLSAGTVLYTVSGDIVNPASSLILLITWTKDFGGNATEDNNALKITVSSTAAFTTVFDAETQRNYKDIAVNRTLMYPNLSYLHSSNSITGLAGLDSGSSVTVADWIWIPYNKNRAGSYSRFACRFQNINSSSFTFTIAVSGNTATWNSLDTDFLNATVVGI